METKVCSKCGIEKPITEFYKHGRNSKGEQTYRSDCKKCQHLYDANRYAVRHTFEDAQRTKCAKCGETRKELLHFHHIDPTQKKFTIGKTRNYSLEKIQEEINKCIVLCASCHKKFHWLASLYGTTIEEYLKN